MVSFIVRFKFAPEDATEAAATVALLATESRKEAGCISYIPHQVQDDPQTILIYEQYESPAALEAHRASDHFRKHATGMLFVKAKERRYENLVALV